MDCSPSEAFLPPLTPQISPFKCRTTKRHLRKTSWNDPKEKRKPKMGGCLETGENAYRVLEFGLRFRYFLCFSLYICI